MEGWIKLHRPIQDHWLWDDKPFSKGQAWIDLLLMANHADNKFLLGNDVIVAERGTFITSELKLMERWGWSKTKVRGFLDLLQKEQMLEKKADKKKTALTIVNYSVYQETQTTEKPQKNQEETTDRPQKDTNKNDKNDKNDKNNNISHNFNEITDLYNSICTSFPKCTKLSEKRKKAIKARMETGYTVSEFEKLFKMTQESDFLKGKNNRNWSASFDWLIQDGNMAKVLDGNYKNKDSKQEENKYSKYVGDKI